MTYGTPSLLDSKDHIVLIESAPKTGRTSQNQEVMSAQSCLVWRGIPDDALLSAGSKKPVKQAVL